MTKTAETAAEPRIPLGKAPMGWAPVTRYARVRTASGLVSTDANGEVRVDSDGNPVPCQRGECVDISAWRHAGRLLEQKSILAIPEDDWESAVACPHGRRFANASLAAGCRSTEPARVTSL